MNSEPAQNLRFVCPWPWPCNGVALSHPAYLSLIIVLLPGEKSEACELGFLLEQGENLCFYVNQSLCFSSINANW